MNEDTRMNEKGEVFKMRAPAERNQILSLSPKEAFDAILDSANPTALVQSFPEEDLYLLIHEIGVEDALPLLSMASNQQWEYFLDIEIWEGDRMEISSATQWLNMLLDADPNRFVGSFFNDHLESIELYLFKNIEVIARDYDQDPSELGDEYFSLDDVFYIKIIDDPHPSEDDLEMVSDPDPISASESDDDFNKKRKEFLKQLLQRVAEYDHPRYQKIMLETATVIPAEIEEGIYRLRNVRLAEKGFLPFDDAIGIYQPLRTNDIEYIRQKPEIGISDPELNIEVPYYPGTLIPEWGLFGEALTLITDDELIQRIQGELAGLSNQLIVADRLKVKSRDQLKIVVRKACGYITIGLEEFMEKEGKISLERAAILISSLPLFDIFKIGYGRGLSLKWQAEKWQKKSWPSENGFPLGFWGEKWLGILGGLLLKKPLYFDNYKTGVLYREFTALDDIKETEKALNDIMSVDKMLSLLPIPDPSLVPKELLSYKNLVLTLWAKHHLNLVSSLEPITLNDLESFFNDLWEVEDNVTRVRMTMKASFLEWLANTTGLSHNDITAQLGGVLDEHFEEIENEYRDVSVDQLDPRYIMLFLVRAHP